MPETYLINYQKLRQIPNCYTYYKMPAFDTAFVRF